MSGSGIYASEKDVDFATNISMFVESPVVKKQILNAVLLVKTAGRYFEKLNVDIDTTCLCCVENFIQQYGMADLYINGYYVNVVDIEKSNEYKVPCIHFSKNVTPVAYMFIRPTDDDMYDVEGFVLKDDIDTSNVQDGYYVVDKSIIQNFIDIEYVFSGHVEESITNDFEKQIFDYFDGISIDMDNFIQILLNSKEARSIFLNAYKAKYLFNYISVQNDVVQPDTDADEGVLEDIISSEKADYVSENKFTDSYATRVDGFDIAEIVTEDDLMQGASQNFIEDEPDEQVEDILQFDNADDTQADSAYEELFDAINTEDRQESVKDNIPEQIIDEDENDAVSQTKTVSEELYSDTAIEEQSDDNESNIGQLFEEQDSIASLYDNQNNEIDSTSFVPKKKNSQRILPVLLVVSLMAVAGYYGYTKFYNQANKSIIDKVENYSESVPDTLKKDNSAPEAMPTETVENDAVPQKTEEAVAVSIPAIERNLDSSVLIENLAVNWQVPANYASNITAKKYFTKVGKIVQLNLKTELLLISNPPLSDKVVLELEFNQKEQNFEIKNITQGSGENEVDNLIKQIVQKTLHNAKLVDMTMFNNISNNPILIIHF